jgi:MFS family permease
MMGADAAMVVALADSVFFSVEPDAARSKVLLFLVVSFAPFLLIAPLIGPLLDRIAGGRRAVIQFVALSRVVISILMALFVDDLMLFPLAFSALVLQRTYMVSKSAIVPSVVRTEADFVEANSKLGLISGIIGAVAVVPAAVIRLTPLGSAGILAYAAAIFVFALIASTWLAADVVARDDPGVAERVQLHSPQMELGTLVMTLLRAMVGFVFFLIAMVLKESGASLSTYGTAVSAGAIGIFLGNAAAGRLRRWLRERQMLLCALGVASLGGVAAVVSGGTTGLVLMSFAINNAAAIGRLGFEAVLQSEAPAANRGRAFARFETRFQFAWALAGLMPVVVSMSSRIGATVVAALCVGGLVYTVLLPKIAPGVTVTAISDRAVARIKAHRASRSVAVGRAENDPFH